MMNLTRRRRAATDPPAIVATARPEPDRTAGAEAARLDRRLGHDLPAAIDQATTVKAATTDMAAAEAAHARLEQLRLEQQVLGRRRDALHRAAIEAAADHRRQVDDAERLAEARLLVAAAPLLDQILGLHDQLERLRSYAGPGLPDRCLDRSERDALGRRIDPSWNVPTAILDDAARWIRTVWPALCAAYTSHAADHADEHLLAPANEGTATP